MKLPLRVERLARSDPRAGVGCGFLLALACTLPGCATVVGSFDQAITVNAVCEGAIVKRADCTLPGPNVEKKKYPVNFAGTAGVSDAFIGTVRLRIANERSITGNIKELLRQLESF